MKLYNSSNYTDDVRYEGRLLEIPFSLEEFKLVLVMPNETDVLNSLFSRLISQGMVAAVSSLQPLFTAKSVLMPPRVDVTSRVQINENIKEMPDGLTIQYGTLSVSHTRTRIKVLTCLYYPANAVKGKDQVKLNQEEPSPPPYYFALVYNDTPIFYGDINNIVSRTK
uniref:Serpin domain-containing protein n=1 Tax=Heliothis virescens TaxID=7102 RepID=A0A2A4JND9_HELVI